MEAYENIVFLVGAIEVCRPYFGPLQFLKIYNLLRDVTVRTRR